MPNMPILTQTLKDHDSETFRLFELNFFMEMYFDKLYLGSTRAVLEIDQLIRIIVLSMPVLKGFKKRKKA
jgi:hypothetical protein